MFTWWLIGGLVFFFVLILMATSEHFVKKHRLESEIVIQYAWFVFIVCMFFWPILLVANIMNVVFPPKNKE